MIRSKFVYLAATIIAIGTLFAAAARFQLKRHAMPVGA